MTQALKSVGDVSPSERGRLQTILSQAVIRKPATVYMPCCEVWNNNVPETSELIVSPLTLSFFNAFMRKRSLKRAYAKVP